MLLEPSLKFIILKDNNACLNNPCLNGGTCTTTGTGTTYICSCRPGFAGTTCQICKNIQPNKSLIKKVLINLIF